MLSEIPYILLLECKLYISTINFLWNENYIYKNHMKNKIELAKKQ